MTQRSPLNTTNELRILSNDQLDVLINILGNMIEFPNEPKYFKLSKKSQAFQEKLCDQAGRVIPLIWIILKDCGFQDGVDDVRCVSLNKERTSKHFETLMAALSERQKTSSTSTKSLFNFSRRKDTFQDFNDQLKDVRAEQRKKYEQQFVSGPDRRNSGSKGDASAGCVMC